MKTDQMQIVPGRNRWIIARTDRDNVQADGVRLTALVVLKLWLQGASPVGMRAVYTEHPGQLYAIGAARLLSLEVSEKPLELERLPSSQRFEDCPTVRVVNARSPWWLRISFQWHGPLVTRAWPRLSVNAIGIEDSNDQGLDWLLIEAGSEPMEKQLGKVG